MQNKVLQVMVFHIFTLPPLIPSLTWSSNILATLWLARRWQPQIDGSKLSVPSFITSTYLLCTFLLHHSTLPHTHNAFRNTLLSPGIWQLLAAAVGIPALTTSTPLLNPINPNPLFWSWCTTLTNLLCSTPSLLHLILILKEHPIQLLLLALTSLSLPQNSQTHQVQLLYQPSPTLIYTCVTVFITLLSFILRLCCDGRAESKCTPVWPAHRARKGGVWVGLLVMIRPTLHASSV